MAGSGFVDSTVGLKGGGVGGTLTVTDLADDAADPAAELSDFC